MNTELFNVENLSLEDMLIIDGGLTLKEKVGLGLIGLGTVVVGVGVYLLI